ADCLGLSQADQINLSRILEQRSDESSTDEFFFEQPYAAGHWKGGRMVVEYAHDLSYTIVSIYDKDGKRQRIYSVRAHPERGQAPAKQTIEAAPPPPPALPPTARPERPSQTREAGSSTTMQVNASEWNDQKQAYVPASQKDNFSS